MQTEWRELRIHWPDGPCGITVPKAGDEAHKLAAKAAGQGADDPRCRIDDALLHHHTREDGRRVNTGGLSPIRFGASRGSMTVTAVGGDAVDVLERSGHNLTRAIGRMAQTPLRESWRTGALSIKQTEALYHYRVQHFVMSRKPLSKIPVGDDLEAGALTPAVSQWMEGRIREGLGRQARLVGLPEVEDDALLRVISVAGFSGWNRGGHYFGSLAHDAVFASDVFLHGPWAVGSLCLLGSGRVSRCHADA